MKINLIIPYFGTFPTYFQLFLNSCSYNPAINWTILTDDKHEYQYPENVKVMYMSFDNLAQFIQSKFDFEVNLNKPYKLCEFKPTYGYLFPDIVKGYDYWGYCDIDVIYGDIQRFLPTNMEKYGKLFTKGHFTLIKNEDYYNKLFMEPIKGINIYKEVFSKEGCFNFDEDFANKPNINTIFRQKGIPIYSSSNIADVYTKSSDFRLVTNEKVEEKKDGFFIWKDGKLERIIRNGECICNEEYMYIHLQKRKMKMNIAQTRPAMFKVIPNSFDYLEIPYDSIVSNFDRVKKKHINNQYFRIRYKNLKVKILNLKPANKKSSIN